MLLVEYANPVRFLNLTEKLLPWLIAVAVTVGAIGLYLSFFYAPEDYQQGQTVRIMFIHVPAAWMSMMCFALMTVASIGTLVWRHPLADVFAKVSAPIGATFTFITLATGSIWGKPMWGTWWVWDARLTSVLVLFIIYLGLIAVWRTFEDPNQAGKVAAVLTLLGSINLPIIKFSVDWWNTLHQPAAVVRLDGPTIHPQILTPLLVMAFSFMLLYAVLQSLGMRNEIFRRRVRALRMRIAGSVMPD